MPLQRVVLRKSYLFIEIQVQVEESGEYHVKKYDKRLSANQQTGVSSSTKFYRDSGY
ncbi:hypothetical protein [Nostoc sp. WHI]|uniref:hypothetical protein n=1 Tax=Nostoc sp. WHI TaxID=2650611 RepID=UPI0018C78B60|nr:hypothetical protein [Nostoc sp. WHI]